MEIRYEHLNPENFDAYSLDTFQRRQAVKPDCTLPAPETIRNPAW